MSRSKKDSDSTVKGQYDEAGEEWLTAPEAAERLGITRRHFQRIIAVTPIPGTKQEGNRKLYPGGSIDELVVDDHGDEQQSAMSALMREVARAAKEVHGSAALALDSAAKSIEGTNLRTDNLMQALLKENERLTTQCEKHEQEKLAIWELFRAMNEAHVAEMGAAARRERERIIEGARGEVLADGFRLAWPGLINKFLPSKEGEKTILGMAFDHLSEQGRGQLMAIVSQLPAELQASVMTLVSEAIEGEAKRKEALQKKKAGESSPPA